MSEQIREILANTVDGHVTVVNESDMETARVLSALGDQHPELATLVRWAQKTRHGGLVDRDKYLTPRNIFDQMRVAQEAAESDDVVSGVLDGTESLAFNRMSVEVNDDDEKDVWNQIIDDIDLDTRIREMWREMFTVSQFYCAAWWGIKDYKVKGKSKAGVTRKRQFKRLRVPLGVTLLDPLKIAPVGNLLFNQEQLCWIATRQESILFDNILSGQQQDEVIERLIVGRYEPSPGERLTLAQQGLDPNRLFVLNPQNVWRVTATRSQYKPYADIRMKSVFELLDIKHQLREMERAHLLGATNFILLVRKGSDKMPAKNEELQGLRSSVQSLSQIPVLIGDHRLDVEIITPKVDWLLQPEKHNMIDARITARLYQMFMTGNFAAGAKGDDSMKLVRIVARGLESRRQMLRRSIEDKLLQKTYEANEVLTLEPSLVFHPKSIAIDFDPGLAAYFMDLYDRDLLPYTTLLEQVDLDVVEEAQKREREKENFDEIFNPLTPIPDPKQAQEFSIDTLDHQQQLTLELNDTQHKQQQSDTRQQQNFLKENPHLAQPAPGAKPSAPAAGPAAPKAPAKKNPTNADPKSGGRSGGGNRSGGGSAPGSGQGEPKDPRRKAKG